MEPESLTLKTQLTRLLNHPLPPDCRPQPPQPQEVVVYLQDPKALKDKVKWLFQKHCGEAAGGGGEEDADVEREAARQVGWVGRPAGCSGRLLGVWPRLRHI